MPFRLRTVVTADRKQVGKKSKKVLEKRKKVVTLQSRFTKTGIKNAEIAQLVEHDLAKVGVASSSLVFRSKRLKIKQLSLPKQKFGRLFCCENPLLRPWDIIVLCPKALLRKEKGNTNRASILTESVTRSKQGKNGIHVFNRLVREHRPPPCRWGRSCP